MDFGEVCASLIVFLSLLGNTALLAANLLFEMLCALPKVTAV